MRSAIWILGLVALAFVLPASTQAQQWSGIIYPSRATDWSNAGINGGIPTRTTICATLDSSASAAQMNSAIASCPSDQVVQLGAGTFNLSSTINIYRSNVTLRGQGMSTVLNFANSGGTNYFWGSTLIAVQHSMYDPSGDPFPPGIGGVPASTIQNWTGTNGQPGVYTQGATLINLASAPTGLAVGGTLTSGTPTITLSATNSAGTGTATLSLTINSASSGRTFYVDSTAGNDSNAGTNPSTPWQNAPGMTAYTGSGSLQPGDTVYFNSGRTWLATGNWGLSITGGVTYIGDTWPSTGSRAIIRLNAQPADPYGVVDWRQDNATAPTTLQGFDVDANHFYSDGISVNHAHYGSSPLTGALKTINNVVAHNVASTAANGQYAYGIIISNHGGTTGQVSNVLVENSVVHDISRDGLDIYPGDENQQCMVSNITLRNNVVYNVGQDSTYGAGAAILVKGEITNAYVEYNYVYGPGAPDQFGAGIFMDSNETNPGIGMSNIHIRYNVVNWNLVGGGIRVYNGATSDPKDVRIYGNLVYNSMSNGGFVINSDLKGTNSIRLYNNTFFNAPITVTPSGATYTTFDVRNNIAYGGGITGSNFFTTNTNNLTTNPSFKNTGNLPNGFTGTYGVNMAPNADGLSLVSGSPALAAGTTLPSPYDNSINSVARPGSGWDLGAYQSAITSAPPPPTGLKATVH